MLQFIFSIIVLASIDSTSIYIGDQTHLTLQATVDEGQRIQMPVYGEDVIREIEIVRRTSIDTIRQADGRLQLSQRLTITSFHDSLYYISPIPFVVGSDTLWSDPLTLNVIQPFEIDTANAITPIKDIEDAPIPWKQVMVWVLILLLVLGLLYALYLAWKKWGYLLKHEQPPVTEPEIVRPAEDVAMERLDSLRESQLWLKGQEKEYHTELTDVIREYISRRYDVSSSEKTSDETLQAMRPILKDQREVYAHLSKILQTADLVKFAKWVASIEENEDCLRMAYIFVKETTPQPEPSVEMEQSEPTDSSTQKRSASQPTSDYSDYQPKPNL